MLVAHLHSQMQVPSYIALHKVQADEFERQPLFPVCECIVLQCIEDSIEGMALNMVI